MKVFIFLFYTAAVAVNSSAQVRSDTNVFQTASSDTLSFTLQEAVQLGLERNPDFTIQRLEPSIMKSYVDEQSSVFDPSLALSTTSSETKSLRFLGTKREPVYLVTTRTQYDAMVSETLPTGTTVSVNGALSGNLSNVYTDQYSGNIGLTVTQSLLKGLSIGYNLASLRRARLDLDITQEELKASAEQLVSDVEKAYWDLYLKAEEITIRNNSFGLANRQLQETLERVAVGRLPELELASVRAEVANRKEALIDAQSEYEQARLNFIFLLNPKENDIWSVVPVPVDKPFFPVDTLDALSAHEELGLKYRPDLRQARIMLKQGEIDVVRTRNGLLPRLDIFINVGRTSYANSFKEALPDLKSDYRNVDWGVTFDFPVLDRQARAQYSRAKKTREQMELSLENMKRMVQWDIRAAYVEVLRSRQQIEATRATSELQKNNLDAELEKFRVGKSTNLQVLQVQRDFISSQLDEIRSMIGYLSALIDLYVSEGSLLERRGIQSVSGSEE